MSGTRVMVNGREVTLPGAEATAEQLKAAGNVPQDSMLVQQDADANHFVQPGQRVKLTPNGHFASVPVFEYGAVEREVVITGPDLVRLRAHLFDDPSREQHAFLLAAPCDTPGRLRLLVREQLLSPPGALAEQSGAYVQVGRDRTVEALKRCYEEGLSLVEVHSHPFCGHGAAFSSIDVRNELAKFPYVAERIPDIHHATLVFGTESVDGHYWDRRAQRIVPVDRLRVIDAPLQVLTTTSGGRRCTATAWQRFLGWCGRRALAEAPDDLPASVQRQVLAFGAEGQRRIGETTIGVVGLGGLGSLTVQMLAHLGCGELVLVDDDRVEETNLNRLVGAEPADAACKLPKVMAAARMARRINPRTKVTLADARLQNPEATDALRRCDAVFGALDNHGARLLLNEFCCRYLLPYIDMGTGLRVTPDAPLQAGGQVRLVLPGGFCLECIGGIDRQRAAYDLMSLEGQERQRVRGYVEGADVPAPAVIFLNTTIAAIAVQECVNLLCGFKPAHRLIHWDATACLARPLDGGLRREDCVVCGQGQLLALGDLSRLEPATPAPLPEALVAVATPA